MMFLRSLLALTLLCGTAALGGCTTAVILASAATAGAGIAQGQAESFINGELKAARMTTLVQAEHATLAAMHDIQVEVITLRTSKYDRFIMAKAEGGPEIKTTLTAKSPVMVKFEVRVGIIGDQAVSQLVMSRIDAMLEKEEPIETPPMIDPQPATPAREEHDDASADK